MWTIRNADAGDAAAIEDFLLSVPEFRGTLHAVDQRQIWKWLYSRNGEPVELVLIAENAQGAVIAHYGLSRLPYVVAGQKVEAAMACLLAIDGAYRKSTVFLDVTIRLLKLFRTSGGAFVTALANRAGLLEFHKAFGFKDIGEVPVFAKPLSLGTIAKRQLPRALYLVLSPIIWFAQWAWLLLLRWNSRKTSSGVSMEPIRRFDESVAAASAGIAKHHKYHAERDAALLNARFFGLTCRDYHVFRIVSEKATIGYVALRVMDMKGFRAVGIVDIAFDFCRRDVARSVLRAIDGVAIEEHADLVSILTNSAPLIAQLRGNSYFRTPESFRLIILEPGKAFGLAASRIDDWFVTWFEHDYV